MLVCVKRVQHPWLEAIPVQLGVLLPEVLLPLRGADRFLREDPPEGVRGLRDVVGGEGPRHRRLGRLLGERGGAVSGKLLHVHHLQAGDEWRVHSEELLAVRRLGHAVDAQRRVEKPGPLHHLTTEPNNQREEYARC